MKRPDWQLPPGVDRGLWDYFHASDMAEQYEAQIAATPLAQLDIAWCERHFARPGRLLDLGCGTGRLCRHFALRGYECVGVDLSAAMLEVARRLSPASAAERIHWLQANIAEPLPLPEGSFDYAACLFSTLGMVRGAAARAAVLENVRRLLRPGGTFVLHAHHRFYRGLGLRRMALQLLLSLVRYPAAGDLTMPQAYAGAPLTLHHFTAWELHRLLQDHGLALAEVLGFDATGQPALGWNIYGWLIVARRFLHAESDSTPSGTASRF